MEENTSQKISRKLIIGAIIIAAVIIGGSLLYINYSTRCDEGKVKFSMAMISDKMNISKNWTYSYT